LRPIFELIMRASPILIYGIVAIDLLLESSGIPITNTTLLLLTGALASYGHVNIGILTLSAILGSTAGASLAYLIGLHGGRKALLRLARFFHISEQKVGVAEGWFQKTGLWMIFFSRITPYIRPFACFPAGIARMNFPRFLVAALAGSTIWCIVLLQVGFALGHRWREALFLMQRYTFPTICGLVLLAILYFTARYIIGRHLRSHVPSVPEKNPVSEESEHEQEKYIEV
jgi:membrane protein DedA with SNARE-associated domain